MTDLAEIKPTIELVKQTVTVPEVAEMLGFEPDRNDKIPSFVNPDERTPSLHLYEDHWYDFSAGVGGDVIDLVRAAYHEELTTNEIVRLLWSRALRAGHEPGDVEKQPVRQVRDFSEELEQYVPRTYYWNGLLGLEVPMACRQDTSSPCNLLIPHADQDGVYGVKVRHPNGKKDAWPGSQFTKRLYDPRGWAGPRWEHIPEFVAIITEGETDCWALSDKLSGDVLSPWGQVRVLALPSGAQSWKDAWLEDLKPYQTIWIAMDNDEAGRQAESKLLAKIGPRSRRFAVPQLAKDVREALSMFPDWRPADQLVRN